MLGETISKALDGHSFPFKKHFFNLVKHIQNEKYTTFHLNRIQILQSEKCMCNIC